MPKDDFIYNDWAEDTLEVTPLTIGVKVPALTFHAHTGPELPADAVRALRDYLTQWLTENDTADQDKAPARD